MKYSTVLGLLALASLATATITTVDFTLASDDTEEIDVSISEGDLIRINLRENPTTGYAWRFQNPFQRPSGVYSIEMDNYVEDPNPEAKTGMAGVRTLLLKGEKKGTDDFELVLVRLWEVQDFIEATDGTGKAIMMKDVPNAGYKKVSVTVQ